MILCVASPYDFVERQIDLLRQRIRIGKQFSASSRHSATMISHCLPRSQACVDFETRVLFVGRIGGTVLPVAGLLVVSVSQSDGTAEVARGKDHSLYSTIVRLLRYGSKHQVTAVGRKAIVLRRGKRCGSWIGDPPSTRCNVARYSGNQVSVTFTATSITNKC